jgi:hypothetical protein
MSFKMKLLLVLNGKYENMASSPTILKNADYVMEEKVTRTGTIF